MRLRALLIVLVLTAGTSTTVSAQEGWIDDDGLNAGAGEENDGTDAAEPTTGAPACNWRSDERYYGSGRTVSGDYVYAYIDGLLWRLHPATGEAWVRSWRVCTQDGEQVSSNLDWRRVTAPDPGVLGESLYDEVVEQVPLPEPALSPVGPGFVNLGMWLAVTDPGGISATATAGDVWATTSAQLESTTFDMGDGAVVVCPGAGDPIPPSQLESTDPSPVCGHTYTSVNGREPFVVTVTSTWRVSWTGSGGAGGDLGSLDRTSTVEYPVLEIQTVGD